MSQFTFARPIALAAATMLVGQLAFADDEHHPNAPAAPPAAQPTPGPQGMPDMMRMMQMMGMMGQSGGASGAMDMPMPMPMRMMTERVEGRIAFLRAELKITAAQAGAWDQFAEALRANAKRLSEMGGMGGQMGAGQMTLPQRAAREERMLEARLDGVRRIRSAVDQLYAALSDEQKKLAETMMPPHIGMMPMGRM